MEIIKISKDKMTDLDLPSNVKEVYLLRNKIDVVGYGYINYGNDNEIEIFIKEDYRNDGHGTELFKRLYDDFINEEINLKVSLSNYLMIKIIEHYKTLNLATHDGMVTYKIIKN